MAEFQKGVDIYLESLANTKIPYLLIFNIIVFMILILTIVNISKKIKEKLIK